MRRRDFIKVIAGSATVWPLSASAEYERIRQIGVLIGGISPDDPKAQARKASVIEGLAQAGWIEGRNLRIDFRWGLGNAAIIRKSAAELLALAPDVVMVSGSAVLTAMLQVTHTVPIVFTLVVDPVGDGLVESLAQPGGNATGFLFFEYDISGKWLDLLKQVAPGITRAGVLRDPGLAADIGQFAVIQSVAPSLGLDVRPINVRDAGTIERAITDFARVPNSGLVIAASALVVANTDLIITLANRYKLPVIYYERTWVENGGLISYGPDILEQFKRAAGYIDRILKGEKPSSLPVQAPTKYELVVNLKTAKTLGLNIPPSILSSADKVIE
jgi:putative ABC transport system substrate-binding protein